MHEGTSTDGRPVRLLPITMPGPAAVPLGDWHGRGTCVGEDPDVFFPSHGDPGTEARKVCTACTVREQCLDYAVVADEFGIWGGLDQQERRNLRKRRQRRQKAARAKTGAATGTTGAA
jgi:WhiB family redox-sensing transcriptional regulator